MKKFLKFNIGKTLLYLLGYIIISLIPGCIDNPKIIILSKELYFINNYITYLGQIIGGFIVYFYNFRAFNKKVKNVYFGLELIHNKANIQSKDKTIKIILLIILASLFEFIIIIFEYSFSNSVFKKISNFFKIRIQVLTLIISSILCVYSLNYKLGKHHKFSLIFMSIFVFIQIISEIIIIKSSDNGMGQLFFEVFLMITEMLLLVLLIV